MGSGFTDVDQNETVYPQVRFRKVVGSLLLSSSKLLFRATAGSETPFEWQRVAKHQVSPASYSKSLLKMVLSDGSNATFQLPDRPTLERIRNDVTKRLQDLRKSEPAVAPSDNGPSGKKRSLTEMSKGSSTNKKASSKSFGELDSTSLAVARSTVLSAHPSLCQQHQFLVEESNTVSEEDFWKTHAGLLGEEYARMSGLAKAGSSSILQSHVPASGRVTLGVDEMKCIFILYPVRSWRTHNAPACPNQTFSHSRKYPTYILAQAVHRAYEEKVPLELSDEQFWRKYLESEYFHRDRGRMGTAALNHAGDNTGDSNGKGKTSGPTMEEQDARAAAVGTDDLFSRYDQKLQEKKSNAAAEGGHRRWGTKLAVGQFDLACTMETDRGKLLQGPRDNHPPNQSDDGKGARVVEKYNRHWAMVLHPGTLQSLRSSVLLLKLMLTHAILQLTTHQQTKP
jgi:transcription initiation factor TFIIH subunit 1